MKINICPIIITLTAFAGCTPRNMYVAHDSILGVNASVSQGRQRGQLVVGYDRDFVTIIPKTVKGNDGSLDAMSLVVCTELEVEGIFLNEYSDVIATGDAAASFVNSGALQDASSNCKKQATPANGGT